MSSERAARDGPSNSGSAAANSKNFVAKQPEKAAKAKTEEDRSKSDPCSSGRGRKRTLRQQKRKTPGSVYDSRGIHIATGKDLCDCLVPGCPGCHFPCPKCSSLKCGVDCRVNRKYAYESVTPHN